MFGKKQSKLSNSKMDPSTNCGKDCVKNNKEEKLEIIVSKEDSTFSRSAITLLLGNLATSMDIKNILETVDKFKIERSENRICEFCKKKSDSCRVCCANKEMRMYLLNNALLKLGNISICSENCFCAKMNKNKTKTCCTNTKVGTALTTGSDCSTFKKLKTRLENLKKYYPDIYNSKEDIIELWGKDDKLRGIKQKILDYDERFSNLFWI